jgi:uncharacterized OB-fold protein
MHIIPEITELTSPYWEGAREGKLMVQHCPDCGSIWHPPEPICGNCQSDRLEWEEASGRGVIYSYTVIHHPTHPAFDGKTPYLVALVDLSEGPRIVTSIRGCAMEDVHVGMPVEVLFEEVGTSVLPYFRPTTASLSNSQTGGVA